MNLKKTHTKTSQLIIGGKIIDDDQKLATNFNEFFVNVGPSTENTIPKVPNISPTNFLKNRNQINFVIAHISNDIISSLENKSTGPSSIPLKLLTLILDLIIVPLAYIINMSLLTGEYPDLLKLVMVVPIDKGGSTQDVNNYTIIDRSLYYPFLIKLLKNECIKGYILFLRKTIYYFVTNLDSEKTIQLSMFWHKSQR